MLRGPCPACVCSDSEIVGEVEGDHLVLWGDVLKQLLLAEDCPRCDGAAPLGVSVHFVASDFCLLVVRLGALPF